MLLTLIIKINCLVGRHAGNWVREADKPRYSYLARWRKDCTICKKSQLVEDHYDRKTLKDGKLVDR